MRIKSTPTAAAAPKFEIHLPMVRPIRCMAATATEIRSAKAMNRAWFCSRATALGPAAMARTLTMKTSSPEKKGMLQVQ